MTPGTVVLLHAPNTGCAAWGDLPETLRSYDLDVVAPDVHAGAGARYVARAALIIAATAPATPLVLAAHGADGPLLPAIALAQRAAHRAVGGYLFVDADLPRPAHAHEHDHDAPGEHVPAPPDWPDAPCGYLRTHTDRTSPSGHAQAAREARLRGWPVTEQEPPATVAQSLSELLTAL